MDRNQIMDTFRSLAMSKGFYGRLVRQIESLSESDRDALMSSLEEKNFADSVDLVMYIEG